MATKLRRSWVNFKNKKLQRSSLMFSKKLNTVFRTLSFRKILYSGTQTHNKVHWHCLPSPSPSLCGMELMLAGRCAVFWHGSDTQKPTWISQQQEHHDKMVRLTWCQDLTPNTTRKGVSIGVHDEQDDDDDDDGLLWQVSLAQHPLSIDAPGPAVQSKKILCSLNWTRCCGLRPRSIWIAISGEGLLLSARPRGCHYRVSVTTKTDVGNLQGVNGWNASQRRRFWIIYLYIDGIRCSHFQALEYVNIN